MPFLTGADRLILRIACGERCHRIEHLRGVPGEHAEEKGLLSPLGLQDAQEGVGRGEVCATRLSDIGIFGQ